MKKSRAVVGAVVLAVVGGSLGTAGASPVSRSSDATWQANGRVNSVTYSPDGTTMYLGGIFDHLCPPRQATCDGTGPQDLALRNLAALDVATGAPVPGFRPQPDAEVSSVAVSPDGATLYAGGVFNNLLTKTGALEAHRKLAAVRTADGTPIASWKPVVNSSVKAVALSPDGSVVYAGGAFTTVNGSSRLKLAAGTAWSPTTPSFALLPWQPDASGSKTVDKKSIVPPIVNALAVRPNGEVFAAGVFATVGGATRNNIAALRPATGGGLGTATAFTTTPELNYITLTVTLTRDGSTVFANGRGPGGFVWAMNADTGAQLWTRKFDGDVQAAVATDTLVYIGGHFDFITIPKSSLREERRHIAALDAFTGKTDPFNPKADSVYGVYGMAFTPGRIAAVGDFTKINGLPNEAIAQFTGGDTQAPAAVRDLAATSTAKGRVDLSWSPVADGDSTELTYYVYRQTGAGAFVLLDSLTGPSAPGTGPLTFSDSTGTIGTAYTYQVRAADPVFLSPAGTPATATVLGNQFAPGAPTAVQATSPSPGNSTSPGPAAATRTTRP